MYALVPTPGVLYRCRTCPFKPVKQYALQILHNGQMRKREYNYTMKRFIIFPFHHILIQWNKDSMAGKCSILGDKIKAQRIVVVHLGRCRPLGRSKHGCRYNDQMGVCLVSCNDVDWIWQAKERYQWFAVVDKWSCWQLNESWKEAVSSGAP
jgi:hypothetical protein